jgi:hypothetical protein
MRRLLNVRLTAPLVIVAMVFLATTPIHAGRSARIRLSIRGDAGTCSVTGAVDWQGYTSVTGAFGMITDQSTNTTLVYENVPTSDLRGSQSWTVSGTPGHLYYFYGQVEGQDANGLAVLGDSSRSITLRCR